MISVVILTKDEENDLSRCLTSVAWTDDVHVLDSGSTDKTIEIARKSGAKTAYHPFESFGKQRNYALENLNTKYQWILFLDADEVVTEAFKETLKVAVNRADEDVAGFYCCWKMMLEETWLKYSDNFPKWQFRVLKKGRAEFTDFGHGQKEGKISGKIGYIKEPYLHYSFSKGWTEWINRHNKYSSLEAEARLHKCPPLRKIFSRNSSTRNPALKSWLSRVPGWPLLRFMYAYLFNFGFLEGIPGLIYCTNISYHEFLITIKMRELRKLKSKNEVNIVNKFKSLKEY